MGYYFSLFILLAVLPSAVGYFLLRAKLKDAVGSLHQWLADSANRVDKLEGEIGSLSKGVGKLQQSKSQDQLIQAHRQLEAHFAEQNRQMAETISGLEAEVRQLSQRLNQVHLGSTISPQSHLPASAGEQFSSPSAREVLVLFGKGLSAAEIAKATGLHVGEVELIRGLKGFAAKEPGRT